MSLYTPLILIYKNAIGIQLEPMSYSNEIIIKFTGSVFSRAWDAETESLVFDLQRSLSMSYTFFQSDIGKEMLNNINPDDFIFSQMFIGSSAVLWKYSRRQKSGDDRIWDMKGDTIAFDDLIGTEYDPQYLFTDVAEVPSADKYMLLGALSLAPTLEQINKLIFERHIGSGRNLVWFDIDKFREVLMEVRDFRTPQLQKIFIDKRIEDARVDVKEHMWPTSKIEISKKVDEVFAEHEAKMTELMEGEPKEPELKPSVRVEEEAEIERMEKERDDKVCLKDDKDKIQMIHRKPKPRRTRRTKKEMEHDGVVSTRRTTSPRRIRKSMSFQSKPKT